MKNTLCAVLVVFSMVSCENLQTVIDIELPEHEPKLVVNSTNKVGEKWKAYVSVSQAPLSSGSFEFLSDATVLLMDDETIIDSMTYDALNNRYYSDLIVQQGTSYQIRVSHPRFETISASLYPFEKVPIQSVQEFQAASIDNTSLRFTIDDPQTVNYYMINLKAYFPEQDNDSIWDEYYVEKEKIYFDSDDPSLIQGFESRGKVLFNDKLFNGSTKELNLIIDDYFIEEADSILLNLWSLDYAYYQYFSTKIVQSNTGNNPIFNSEPVNVYNSFLDENGEIKGYGVFAVSNKDSIIIRTE